MAYTNSNGQVRIGVRSGITNSPIIQPAFSASLLQSLYGVWNGDTTTNELDKSLFGVWNGETTSTVTTLSGSVSSAWNGDNFYSTSGITASNVNNVTLSTGKIGNAFTFNGSNYVSIPSSVMNFTGDFTVNFWIKINSTAVSNQGIMGNKRWSLGPGGFEIIFNNGWLQALGGNQQNGASGFATNGNLTLANATTWTMVTFIYRKGVSNSFYINAGTSYTTAHQHTLESSIFNGQLGSEPMDNYRLNGNLDAVTFWDRAITQNEIYALYNSTNGREYPYPSTISVDIPSPNDSFGTNHGTLIGGCTYTTGKIGNAFTFDGVNDYIEFPSNTMNLTGDFTISFWIYMRTRDTNNIMSNHGNDGINRGFYIDSDGSYALRFVANYLAPYYSLIKTDNSALFDLNVWNHYTFISKNGIGQWYKNGVANGASGTVMTNGYITNNKPIIGGYRSGNAGAVGYNKNMVLDAFTIWNKAISQDEVTQLYNSGTGAQYPFTGTFSSAGNQLGVDNGTLMNGASLSTGKIGQAFTFDGVNDYVSLPNNSLNLTTFSISAWVNPSNTVGSRTILNSANYVSALDYGWKFRIIDGQLSLQIFSTGGLINEYKGGGISTNTWTHVSATRINGSTKLYINGSLVGSQTSGSINNNPNFTTTTYCSIGSLTSAVSPISFFIGSIDSINVWQKELTQSEVTELYNSGNGKQITTTPIVQTGLVLNLDASRSSSYTGTGTTWTDISGNSNNGTLVNGPIFGTASGGVITFDGVNDYVDFGNNTTLYNTSDSAFTQEFVIRLKSNAATDKTIFRVDDWSRIWTQISTSQFKFRIGYDSAGTPTDTLIYNGTFEYNQWYIITTVWSKLNTQKIYINGVLVAQRTPTISTYTGVTGTSGGANIGRGHSDPYANYLNFDMSTFRHYNKVLTDTEITQNFNSTKGRL